MHVCLSAAVVGVILNLSLWFALHIWLATGMVWRAGPVAVPLPDPDSVDLAALALAAITALGAMLHLV